MFIKKQIQYDINPFESLSVFSDIFTVYPKDRKCGIIAKISEEKIIPIIRSTTSYDKPTSIFLHPHQILLEKINNIVPHTTFNNAMVEIYNCNYTNMKYHSDQALDLCNDSYICLFSCYNDPNTKNTRKLCVKNKNTNICENTQITLDHCSIVLFSVDTNSKFVHKIVLDTNKKDNTLWLGITFRLSKTFIKFIDNVPYFLDGTELKYANDTEITQFYKNKNEENNNDMNHNSTNEQCNCNYTLSLGDLIEPDY